MVGRGCRLAQRLCPALPSSCAHAPPRSAARSCCAAASAAWTCLHCRACCRSTQSVRAHSIEQYLTARQALGGGRGRRRGRRGGSGSGAVRQRSALPRRPYDDQRGRNPLPLRDDGTQSEARCAPSAAHAQDRSLVTCPAGTPHTAHLGAAPRCLRLRRPAAGPGSAGAPGAAGAAAGRGELLLGPAAAAAAAAAAVPAGRPCAALVEAASDASVMGVSCSSHGLHPPLWAGQSARWCSFEQ
jgi:hypothetical protein